MWFLQRLPDGTITYEDTRWLTQPVAGDPDWKMAAVVDLNNDHRADIVWQHQAGGWLAVWYMWTTSCSTRGSSIPTGWPIRDGGSSDRNSRRPTRSINLRRGTSNGLN